MKDSRRQIEPRPWFATPSGKRYHDSPYCHGIHTRDVIQLTSAQVRARSLTPCRACQPSPVTQLRLVK